MKCNLLYEMKTGDGKTAVQQLHFFFQFYSWVWPKQPLDSIRLLVAVVVAVFSFIDSEMELWLAFKQQQQQQKSDEERKRSSQKNTIKSA